MMAQQKNNPMECLEHLREVAEYLIPHTYPVSPASVEEEISVLKKMEFMVDGHNVVVYFNKANYGGYFLETFQILGKNSPFLPFQVVVKLAQVMLGDHYLSFVEFYQDDRKVYCWSVCVDQEGKPKPSPIEETTVPCEFEGFEYKSMHINQLNFY